MNVTIEKKKNMSTERDILEEVKTLSLKYGCELIQHNAIKEQLTNKYIPNDTFIIKYKVNDNIIYDLCRSKRMVDIFDLYYDVFGKNSILLIEFGYGMINPRVWADTSKKEKGENKKRRRS